MIKLLAVIALGFVIALAIRHLTTKLARRKAVRAGPPLQVTEENGWTTIATLPAPLPARVTVVSWALGLFAAWVGGALGLKIGGDSPLWMVLGLACWIGASVLFTALFKAGHDANRKVQRAPFQVSAQGVRLPGGTLITPGQIYAIKRGNTQSGRVVIIGGTGVAAGVSQAAATTADLLGKVSYTVEVEHGGTSTVLAGGLTETQAHAVAAEIARRLPGFHR
jgi:hypothetical protein